MMSSDDVVKAHAVGTELEDVKVTFLHDVKIKVGMSESDFLKYINQGVFKIKTSNLEDILKTIAKYDYRILSGSNPEIQLTALLAELSKFGKK